MKKINEFINNNNIQIEFEILDRQLYIETAHLSNLQQIMKTDPYLNMLERGNDFLPFIVERILNSKGTFAHPLLFDEIVSLDYGDEPLTTLEYNNIIKKWWLENKNKYGK
jgi:hypothetical protein